MREIKFSCMWSDGKDWIDVRSTLEQMENGEHFDVMSDNPLLRDYVLKHRRQYTGLKDRNGKEIYEGDIVLGRSGATGAVVFDTDDIASCGCCYAFFSGSGFAAFNIALDDTCTVIGNIYEHPHLLVEGE